MNFFYQNICTFVQSLSMSNIFLMFDLCDDSIKTFIYSFTVAVQHRMKFYFNWLYVFVFINLFFTLKPDIFI